MKTFLKRYKYILVFFIGLFSVIYTLFYLALKPEYKLPVFQPSQVSPALVDSTLQYVKKYHTISDFKLINQNGDSVSQDNFKDKIYVADFFFTTCQSICPVMTKNMKSIQDAFIENPQVMLISYSVTPEIDSVPRLKQYALEKGVDDSKWYLVTGNRKHIYDLARKSYLVAKEGAFQYDMIHTENFVLVDKKRRIRGFYDGTNPKEIKKLIGDIKVLEENYKK